MRQMARDLREVALAQLCIVLKVSPQYVITRVSLGARWNPVKIRALLTVAAFQWRKLAEKAAERQKTQWPFASEAIRPN